MKIKRKYIILLAFIVLLFFSLQFFARRASNLTPKCYDAANNILQITDRYLDHTISAMDAAGQIRDLCHTLSSLPEEAGTDDHIVKNYCDILSFHFSLLSEGDDSVEQEILPARNYLASFLGQASRS